MVDNVTLPAGSGGDTIAADEVSTLNGAASSGVKVQRAKIAYGDDGAARDVSELYPLPTTLKSSAPAYRLFVPAQAAGANKVYFDLFNASGSGKALKLKSVRAVKDGSVAVTGAVTVKLYLTKTTSAGTGGTAATTDGSSLTAITISEHDSSNAALPAQVTARAAPTGAPTAGAVIAERHIMPEETNASTYDRAEFLMPEGLDIQPLVVREGEGIRIVQGAVASVGNIGFDVIFEAE